MDTGGNSLPSASCVDGKKRCVCYYYDPGIAHIKLSDEHMMVPARVAMAHSLVAAYGMLDSMRRLRTRPATESEIRRFHSPEYVDLLRDLTPESYDHGVLGRLKDDDHGLGGCIECPPFDRLWNYCRGYAGGSLAAARALAGGESDVAINWSGGMHHACAAKASGFCYVNDIVLAINELLGAGAGAFRRVLYVDVDAHHGDGVQEAFADSDRVMTLSFHRYGKTPHGGKFFPGTGLVSEIGRGAGEHYTVNVPMDAGVHDDVYQSLFKPIVSKAMEVFDPEAVVLQCGADSLSGDRLGSMELSVRGHAECVSFLRGFNRPLLLLGGGGYTINHVASSWCYETAVAIGKERDLPDEIPKHGYDLFYMNQGNKLHYSVSEATVNSKLLKKAAETKQIVLEHLSQIKAVPSVQFMQRRGVDAGDDLYYECAPSLEEDEPMQRLHRLCHAVGQGKRLKLK